MDPNNFNEVGNFYDNSDIPKLWEIINKRHMHMGYWDDKNMDTQIFEAAGRFTDMLIDEAPIKENENMLDAGCGFGLPSIELVKRKGCKVYGITASRYQRDEAEKAAQREKIPHLTHFSVYDAKNTPFENEKFDAGWFIESMIHIGYEEAIFEARRILKPGAVLLIADFFVQPSLKDEDRKNIHETFHVKSVKTFKEYPLFLEQNGFDLIKISDVTNNTIMMRKKKYIEALNVYKDDIINMSGSAERYEELKHFEISTNEFLEKYVGYIVIKCRKRSLN